MARSPCWKVLELSFDGAEVDAGCRSDAKPKGGNGKVRLLSVDDLDGRTKAAQRARETQDDVLADLGGVENLSTLERLAASHVSVADAMVTDLGVRWLRGDPVDPTAFATLVNTFNRSAAALGWTRRAKDVTPKDDVTEWIEGRLAEKRKPAGESAGAGEQGVGQRQHYQCNPSLHAPSRFTPVLGAGEAIGVERRSRHHCGR